MKFLAIVAALFQASSVFAQDKLDSRIGVANVNQKGDICLTIPNSKLAKGDKIAIILPDQPQKILTATIVDKSTKNCSDNSDLAGEGDFSYLLKTSTGKLERGDLGIAVTDLKKTEKAIKGIVTVDINGDGKNERFRSCTSSEGVWLTIWSGKPLLSKRLWNRYYYLGYDVVPSCKKADYKD